MAFCNDFMNKCSIFTIYASKLLESIKVLCELNCFVAYFLSASLVAIGLGICFGMAKLTAIFWVCQTLLKYLGKNSKLGVSLFSRQT